MPTAQGLEVNAVEKYCPYVGISVFFCHVHKVAEELELRCHDRRTVYDCIFKHGCQASPSSEATLKRKAQCLVTVNVQSGVQDIVVETDKSVMSGLMASDGKIRWDRHFRFVL